MRNIILRAFFLILAIIPLIYLNDFCQHFYLHFTGDVLAVSITNQWHIVSISIIIALAFLIPLSFRRRINWKEYGVVSAFFVSLFVEMYGIPLTTLLASYIFYSPQAIVPHPVFQFTFLGVTLVLDAAMAYGTVLMAIGTLLVIIGWVTLYKGKGLVTTGIYALSRHPQYLGFILFILGWFIGWPTILTAVFTPILIYRYITLCKQEERELGAEYARYKQAVPFLI
jgi:protein-S-isoprenylcysteine O-methyltransferase Ste14